LLVLPDTAGALFRVLEPLSAAGINLTKIESRPSRQQAWDYVFFLDLDGHRDEPRVATALAELDSICQLCKVLGSYRKADEI
jgi:chorismate mutase/prephenate dehydratase